MESFKRKIQKLSKENKGKVYKVRCTNYCDDNRYYLKDGIFCLDKGFNTVHEFSKNKVSLSKLKKDGVYLATEIEPTKKNKDLYNI